MLRLSLLTATALALPSSMSAQAALTHVQVPVAASEGIWTPTGITVVPGDIVIVQAEGEVILGPYYDPVGPDGAEHIRYAGAVELKIGVHPGRRVGAAGCVISDGHGQVRLRVRDSRYDDNSGGYVVNVIHLPVAAVPPAQVAEP